VVGGIVVVLVVGADELDTGSAIRTLVCGVEEDAGGEERSALELMLLAPEVEGVGMAAHFRLTASRVAELAAEALFENSANCWDGGLEADDRVADAQLWSLGKRC